MSWLLLIIAVLGVAALHELAHVLVARLFGYRPLAWGPVTGGAFIIFDDTFEPDWSPFYWPLQLLAPWLATSASLPLVWLLTFRVAGYGWAAAAQAATTQAFVLLSLLISAAGSLGDLVLVTAMPRLAASEPDLTLRDMRLHQALRARPFFTRHGREALQRRYGEPAEAVWERAKQIPSKSLFRLWQRTK